MKLLHDEHAQAGGIMLVVGALFVVGFFYLAFGAIMNQLNTSNNDLIGSSDMAYSQDHKDAAVLNFDYFWGYPVYVLIILAIWGLKNAMRKEDTRI